MRRRKKTNPITAIFACLGALPLYPGFILSVIGDPNGALLILLSVICFVVSIAAWVISENKDAQPTNSELIKIPQKNPLKEQTSNERNVFDRISDDLSKDDIFLLIESARSRRYNYCVEDTYAKTDVKHQAPRYYLQSVEFFPQTKKAKVTLRVEEYYRTVERYQQINYVKHPIYSNWKLKTKQEKYSIDLSIDFLERLHMTGENRILTAFSEDILISISRIDFIPSWMIRKWLSEEFERWKNNLSQNLAAIKQRFETKLSSENKLIAEIKIKEEKAKRPYLKTQKKENNLISKSERISNADFVIFRHSRLSTLARRIRKAALKRVAAYTALNDIIVSIKEAEERLSALIQERELLISEGKAKEIEGQKKHEELLKKISPLKEESAVKDDFSPLKDLSAIPYSLIVGCYVIRNTKNAKCYVGQSHDVIKRIRQHFHGTTPNNTIFAEDYYLTPENEREGLFEYKIFPSKARENLNAKEKKLIEAFDAFNNGYNRTSGNEDEGADITFSPYRDQSLKQSYAPSKKAINGDRKNDYTKQLDKERKIAILRNETTKATNYLRTNNIEGAKQIVLSMETNATDQSSIVPFHFSLLEIMDVAYSLRNDDPAYEDFCLWICDLDIERAPLLLKELETPFFMKTPTRKCIILERKMEYQLAIELCDKAIKWGIWDDEKKSFEDRKERILKKMNK